MGFKEHLRLGRSREGQVQDTNPATEHVGDEKIGAVAAEGSTGGSDEERPAQPTETLEGVAKVEAITTAWSKPALVAVFVNIWLLYFVNAFQASINANLVPYITSDFSSHSLIPVIYVASNVIAGAFRLPIARMLDTWGRPQGYAVMVCTALLGLILMATTQSVKQFAAAQVFYQLGFDGMIYCADVVTADASSLKNRGLAFAITSSPYIITAFAGPKAAEGFYENINYRWGFGIFCIILPVVAAPLFFILYSNLQKAKKQGVLIDEKSGRTFAQSVKHYLFEFDAFGILLFAAGFSLFLLPFSLAESAAESWRTAHIIVMLVLGFVLIIAFALVEKFVVPKPFLPFHLLTNRTVLGTCLLGATFQIGYYSWNAYFSSYLQVVNGLSIAQAGYVGGVFDIISSCWIFVVGFLIRYTGRFKWLLLAAVPLDVFAIGLMINFRKPHGTIGWLIFSQVLISISGGTIILGQQVSIMSVAEHKDLAAVLALLGLFGYIGGAIGNTISGAVWTNTMPQALYNALPDYAKDNATEIYDDIEIQLSYEEGDPVRDAIVHAYGVGQRNMLIAGTCIMALSFIWVLIIQNINVKARKQTKGTVL